MQEPGKDESFRLSIKISKDGREDEVFDEDVTESAILRVLKLAGDLLKKKGDSKKRVG